MKTKRYLVILLALALIFALAACNEPAETPAPEPAPGVETPADPEPAPEQKTFAILQNDMSNPYCITEAQGAIDYIEAKGDVCIAYSSDSDPTKEVENLNDLLALGVDGVIIQAVDGEAAIPTLRELKAAGIPVAVVDCPMNITAEDDLVISMCTTDNYKAGQLCAEHAMAALGAENVRAVAKDWPGHLTVGPRANGFCDAIEDAGATLLERKQAIPETQENNLTMGEEWVMKFPELNALFAGGDYYLTAIIRGLEAQGMEVSTANGVYTYGVDATDEIMQMIKDGLVAGTIKQQPYEMAALGAADLYEYIENGAVTSHEWYTGFEPLLITIENVDEYLAQ